MKLTMLETRTGSEDGIHINTYYVGSTYEVGTDLGSVDAKANTLRAGFTRFLLLQATPETPA